MRRKKLIQPFRGCLADHLMMAGLLAAQNQLLRVSRPPIPSSCINLAGLGSSLASSIARDASGNDVVRTAPGGLPEQLLGSRDKLLKATGLHVKACQRSAHG